MNKTEHTPGPWTMHLNRGNGIFKDSYCIANCEDMGQVHKEGNRIIARTPTGIGGIYEDNARLIAAAPELLEALETLNKLLKGVYDGIHVITDNDYVLIEQAQAAINKAKGNI